MDGTGVTPSNRIDLAPWGYAPGNSYLPCKDCQPTWNDPEANMHWLHAHATRCTEHALEARQNAIRAQEGYLGCEDTPITEETLYGLRKASQDSFIRQAFIASIIAAPMMIGIVLWLNS